MAAIAVSGVQALSKIAGALFAAHTARLAAAKSENAAVANIIAPFDQDVAQLVQIWNTGQADPATFINYVKEVDNNVYNYMKSLVGRSGTAWSDSNGMAGKCDKTCTAACCVYFGDLGPVLSGMIQAAGGTGKWGPNDPRIQRTAGGTVISAPKVFASKYGGVDRAGYSVTMINYSQKPANPPTYAQTGIPTTPVRLGVVSEGTPAGQTPTFSQSSQAGLVNASVLSSSPGLNFATPMQQSGVNTNMLVVLGLGGLAAILAIALVMKS
jgi:hypothetical protein